MKRRMESVCVFCGSSDDVAAEYLEAARRTGTSIARRGTTLVYGGGGTGLMGALADGALESGGRVVGILTEQFDTPALRHPRLSERRVVTTMHERKAMMGDLSEGFIALPGGFGTFEELFEVLCWAQLGLHEHPIGLLNTRGYFGPLMAAIDHALQEGFINNEHDGLYLSDEDPDGLLDRMSDFDPPGGVDRWLRRDA